jgi:VanZ family protein
MLQKIVTAAAWLALGFIVFATLSPIQDRPTLSSSASLERVSAFAALGLLFCLVCPRKIVLVCAVVFGCAVLLELAQLLTPDRHGRIQDAIEKLAGGAVGIVAGRALLHFEPARRWFQA